MFCGTKSFSHVDDDDPAAPPVGLKKKHNKNPYSTRGLDKFSKVMSELQAKREQIMAQLGPHGESMILFMYNNSLDWTPIIVRLQEKPPPTKSKSDIKKPQPLPPPPTTTTTTSPESAEVAKITERTVTERKVKKVFSWKVKEGWRGSYYWPVVMVVILVGLVIFGRMFAICCTTIWWYMVPTFEGDHGHCPDVKVSMKKKKDYGRRMSDKRLGGGGVHVGEASLQTRRMETVTSPRLHGHGKKGLV